MNTKNDIQQFLVTFIESNEVAFNGPCLIRTLTTYSYDGEYSAYIQNNKGELFNIDVKDYGNMICVEDVHEVYVKDHGFEAEKHRMPLYYFRNQFVSTHNQNEKRSDKNIGEFNGLF